MIIPVSNNITEPVWSWNHREQTSGQHAGLVGHVDDVPLWKCAEKKDWKVRTRMQPIKAMTIWHVKAPIVPIATDGDYALMTTGGTQTNT